MKVLKWLREKNCPWDSETVESALHYTYYFVARWAIENGCKVSETALSLLATKHQLNLLQSIKNISISSEFCIKAAESGQLEVLIWAKENGCEFDEEIFATAAKSGKLDIIQWLQENGCPRNEKTCVNAVKKGYFDIL